LHEFELILSNKTVAIIFKLTMETETIIEIGIDDAERLYIRPHNKHFDTYGEVQLKYIGIRVRNFFTRLSQENGIITIGIAILLRSSKVNVAAN
jgi:hypothetical protein